MKTLWNVISILSIAHLLALLALIGFLVATDRLNRERLDEIRESFAITISQQEQIQAEAAEAAQVEAERQRYLASMNEPNLGADARNEELRTHDEILLERQQRAEAERSNLTIYLEQRIAEVEEARRRLEEERAAFDAERERLRRAENDAQFQQAAEIFAGLDPVQQKALVEQYLDRGESNLVIDLLDSLDTRTAQKFFTQFESVDDQTLAADLLMRLRERGFSSQSVSN